MFSFTSAALGDFQDFSNYTLIIPSVSVGNVPQLTVDLIISTYELTKAASIWHPAVVPSVGADPFYANNTTICTACELYTNAKLKLAVIQLRSTLEQQFIKSFMTEFTAELHKIKFGKIIILSSLFAQNMHDVTAPKFLYKANKENLEIPPIGDEDTVGSGFANRLYNALTESDTLNVILIFKYTSEGDNRPDAVEVVNLLKSMHSKLMEKQCDIKFPYSWEFVFGNPPPIGIY